MGTEWEAEEFKTYIKNDYRGSFDDIYKREAISLLEECDNDMSTFLGLVLDAVEFWRDISNQIQRDPPKDSRFWRCGCKSRQDIHSKRQRDNCPKCEAKMGKKDWVWQRELKENRFFTGLDLHDYLCDGGIHEFHDEMDRSCGAYICMWCGWHKGLARCFCGWSVSGGDGRAELIEMGENIE